MSQILLINRVRVLESRPHFLGLPSPGAQENSEMAYCVSACKENCVGLSNGLEDFAVRLVNSRLYQPNGHMKTFEEI